ncbi:hypothetical protein I6332_14350, partial [Enterococcus lactis]|uniref:adhesive domain-containing protein n=1 Tax=Enterococcus lactis TaxID=357441 RepID=UPI001A2B20D1|nr:hypothetical protein [Enterococcus lactis]
HMQGDDYIYGELDGALETVIREILSNILNGINNAVQAIEATTIGRLLGDAAAGTINTALAVTVKPAFNLTLKTAMALVNVGYSFL